MRIVSLSDIHLDINLKRKDNKFHRKLVNFLCDVKADTLIIAGDIAGNTRLLIEFFELSRSIPIENKIYVPGNHDLYVNQAADNLSTIKYYEILPTITEQYDWNYLPKDPFVIDNIQFAGTIGWYDYSSRNKIWDDQIPLKQYIAKKHPNHNLELMDRHFVKFGKSDEQMSQQFTSDLLKDLAYIDRRYDYDEIDHTVIVSHMVPFREFIPYRGLVQYDFFTAYFGNLNLGDTILNYSQNREVTTIFGQVHIPKSKRLTPNLMGYCVPIGYPREYGRNLPLDDLFRNRVQIFDL